MWFSRCFLTAKQLDADLAHPILNDRAMNLCFCSILLGSLITFGSQQPPREFASAVDALYALNHMSECHCDTGVKAFRYFKNHPDESIPVLIDFITNHKERPYDTLGALANIRDERVITFLIKLSYEELNYVYDGDVRSYFNSKELVGHLIQVLGDYGDKRAIPIIEESLGREHNQHRDRDLEALCELGKISIPELFDQHLGSSAKEIHSLASRNEYANPKFSVEVYDWIIDHFPQRRALLKDCHVGKVMALCNLKEYSLALAECEFLKWNIDDGSAKELRFSIDRHGYSLDQMIELLQAKAETRK